MSKGFVNEDDQEEVPLVLPRAELPPGVPNYVTLNGLKALKQEQDLLIEEQSEFRSQSIEKNRVQINFITAKLDLLKQRINGAQVIDLTKQSQDEIHFGATVTLFKVEENCQSQYQIVGVDEADASKNKISFLSPLAKALLNKKTDDEITLQTPNGQRYMVVESIAYV